MQYALKNGSQGEKIDGKPHARPRPRRRVARHHRRRRQPSTPRPSSRRSPPPSGCSTRKAGTSSSAWPTPTPTRAATARRPARPGVAGPGPVPITGNTGDVFGARWNFSGAFKARPQRPALLRLIFDQPYGADTFYGQELPAAAAAFHPLYAGSLADVKTYQITGVLAYDVNPNVKVYGGLRAERLDAKAAVSVRLRLLGRRRQEVGLRLSGRRRLRAAGDRAPGGADLHLEDRPRPRHRRDDPPIGATPSADHTATDVDTPQSVSLEFQTGITPKTLVFGSVRWVDWSEFSSRPPLYEQAIAELIGEPRPLVDYADDWWTYNLGIGRQLTDQPRRLGLDHLRAGRRRRDDLARPLRRAHHRRPSALSYDYGQIERHRRPDLRRARRHHQPARDRLQRRLGLGRGLRVGYTF